MYTFEGRGLGEIFKQVRAERKITISQVESEIKVRRKFLEAIENEEFSQIPNIVVARGFIKLYSDFLGLDSKKLLQKFQEAIRDDKNLQKSDKAQWVLLDSSRTAGILSFKFAAPIFSIILIAFILYFGVSHFKNSLSVSIRTSETFIKTEMDVPRAVVTQPESEKVLLSADFVDRTWVSVELDGKEAFTGVVGRGQKMFWEADKKIKIKAGNGGGVKVAVNERPLGLLGAKGSVIEKEFIR